MALAGTSYAAPMAQTDVFGGRATPSPVEEIPNNTLLTLQRSTACLDPVSILPFELLEVVFQLALPSLDITTWNWYIRACHPHMVRLYILRRVSKAWRDAVDGTPSFWTIISSTFPKDVNRTSLVRSGSSPLVIYFPGAGWSINPPFREFLAIIEPHIQRWSSLVLRLEVNSVDEVPCLSPLRLVALEILIDMYMEPVWQAADIIPMANHIEISNEALENIQNLDLTRAPMDWARTLEHLRGLRTLSLHGVYDDNLTHEQILSVLLASPNIETLTIVDMDIKDPPSSLSPSTEPISLPRLRSFTLITDGLFTNAFLRGIRPPPHMLELNIRPTNLPSQISASFWEETMTPWVPTVQRMYQNSHKSIVRLLPEAVCRLEAYSKSPLFIEFEVGLLILD